MASVTLKEQKIRGMLEIHNWTFARQDQGIIIVVVVVVVVVVVPLLLLLLLK
jgi:hypothetical protein